jgi:diguanylate cyclase (GGDEF)-like protein/PAS domain S-box-containing protein
MLGLRITAKLALALAAGIAIAALTMGAASYYTARATLRTASVAEVLGSGIEKEAAVRAWFEEREDHLARLAIAPEAQEAFAGNSARFMELARGALGAGFSRLRLLARDALPDAVALELGGATSGPGQRLTFTAPVYDANNRHVGDVVGEADLAGLATIVARRPGVRRSFDALLATRDGRVLVAPRYGNVANLDGADLQACAQRDPVVREAADSRGVATIATVRWLEDRELCLIVQLDTAEAYGPTRALRDSLIAAAALLIGVGAWMAWLFARVVTVRLRVLARAVDAFGRGEGHTVPVVATRGRDELGVLGSSLERMMRALRAAQTDLTAYASRLEQRVADRTAELAESETRFRNLAATTFDPLVTISEQRRITFFNAAAERAFDRRADEIANRPLELLFAPESIPPLDDALARVRAGQSGTKPVELVARRRDGKGFAVEVSIAAWDIAGRPAHTLVVRDITERQALLEMLRDLSLRDELTGLHNRRGFMTLADELQKRAMRHQEPFALLFIDLDGFKAVNDNLGHDAGDRVLQRVAEVLRATVRDSDLVARLGGDEFVAMLGEAGVEDANQTELRLREALAAAQANVAAAERVGFSLGTVVHQATDRRSVADLLAEADEAMYRAKRGRMR